MRDTLRSLPVFAGLGPCELSADGLPANPVRAVADWILAAAGAGQPEPHAMTLCTVGANGVPSSRVLLCKDVDDERLYFATPSDSRKGVEIAGNPHVAAQFHWPVVGRQIRIVGTAEALDRAESERDFAERGRGSRLAAHLHRPGRPADRGSVLAELKRLAEEFPESVPCPDSWTRYALTPTEVELWQADQDRLHARISYHRSDARAGNAVASGPDAAAICTPCARPGPADA